MSVECGIAATAYSFLEKSRYCMQRPMNPKWRRYAVFLTAVFAFFSGNAAAVQEKTAIFAPFVSHLQAQVSDMTVTLSWTDSPSIRGPVYIYRAQQVFSGRIPPEAMCAEVYYGRGTYTEAAPSKGTWYYLAVAGDENRQKYELIIPYNNMVEITVDGSAQMQIFQAANFAAPLTSVQKFREESQKAGFANQYAYRTPDSESWSSGQPVSMPSSTLMLTALAAVPEGSGIRLTFVSANPSKNVVIYRNILPIQRISDLLAADVVQLPGAKSPVLDQVRSGVPYYYAVLYEEDLRAGAAYIAPGYNATLYPAVFHQSADVPPSAPYSLSYPADGSVSSHSAGERLSAEAEAALSTGNWSAPIPYQQPSSAPPPSVRPQAAPPAALPPAETIEPQVFQQDLQNAPPGSDEYRLQSIVKSSFTWRNWPQTIGDLQNLIETTRHQGVRNRARFYLGQAYYFTGSYGHAAVEFRAVQSQFPNETAFWIPLSSNASRRSR
jgi:hypothetical protein